MKPIRFSNKYNRSNFLIKEEVDYNGIVITEYDLSTSYFHLFNPKKGIRDYQVERNEQNRPDILSFKIYNSIDYWWIILKLNDIVDPFEEIKEGTILKIPYLSDIQDYHKNVMEQKRKDSQNT